MSDEKRPTKAAIERYYKQRYHRLLRVAEAIIGDPDLAHDAVQDAFVRIIRNRDRFRGDGAVEGWIWKTVVNAARDVRAKRVVTAELPELVHEQGNGSGDPVRALIASLPERQRLVLFLRYYADLDYERIALALGIQSGTVGATLNQAHATLRRLLEEVHR